MPRVAANLHSNRWQTRLVSRSDDVATGRRRGGANMHAGR